MNNSCEKSEQLNPAVSDTCGQRNCSELSRQENRMSDNSAFKKRPLEDDREQSGSLEKCAKLAPSNSSSEKPVISLHLPPVHEIVEQEPVELFTPFGLALCTFAADLFKLPSSVVRRPLPELRMTDFDADWLSILTWTKLVEKRSDGKYLLDPAFVYCFKEIQKRRPWSHYGIRKLQLKDREIQFPVACIHDIPDEDDDEFQEAIDYEQDKRLHVARAFCAHACFRPSSQLKDPLPFMERRIALDDESGGLRLDIAICLDGFHLSFLWLPIGGDDDLLFKWKNESVSYEKIAYYLCILFQPPKTLFLEPTTNSGNSTI